jgi:hypothetical protein
VSPASQTVTAGSVSVDIVVEDAQSMGGYSFDLIWDDSVLGFVSFTNGSFLGSTGRTVSCLPPSVGVNSVSVSCTSTGAILPGPGGTGILATVMFNPVANGLSALDLQNVTISNTLSLPVAVQATDGSVTVAIPTPTPTVTLTPSPTASATPTPTSAPQSLTLSAQADTYVDGGSNSSNYGADTSMFVDAEQSQPQRSFVMFDLSGIPGGSTVDAATLTLCYIQAAAQGTGRTHEVRLVTSSWSESAVTWDTQPALSSTVTDSVVVPSSPQCLTFDVTADVQALIDGTANWGWALSDQTIESGQHYVEYAARENGTANVRPALDLTYTP